MANQLDPMDLKQILTLHLDGLSNRDIGSTLGISRNTINTYINRFKSSEFGLAELLTLDEGRLRELFTHRTTIKNERYDALMLFFETMNESRGHPGFTFQYHYQDYRQSHQNPYSYTQFMEHYRRKYAKEKGSMKLEHEAGREVFVDFAGKKLHIVDQSTGERIAVEVFVSILPHSQYTYVEACLSQKKEDFLGCMGNALQFYGGVPKAIVTDNLKAAVSRACKYEPSINRDFKEFARHHNCVVNPTRTYSPQDKALVENAVHLAYQRIYYPIREMVFFSLEQLNQEIRKHLADYNRLLFKRKQASREELFQRSERQYLKPLPASAYEHKQYKRSRVAKMGYVFLSEDKNYYSVPYRYIGKYCMVHYGKSNVEIYYNQERIALHKRSRNRGCYVTNKDHLCSTHKAYTQWSPDYFKNWAAKHGEHVKSFISGMFEQGDYPEVNYKRAAGLIHLHKKYGSDSLNKACERAMYADSYSYHRVKNILKHGLEQQPLPKELFEAAPSHIPRHENIRGASTYQ